MLLEEMGNSWSGAGNAQIVPGMFTPESKQGHCQKVLSKELRRPYEATPPLSELEQLDPQ